MLRLFLTLPILLSACLKDETVSGYADRNATYGLETLNGQPFTARATLELPEQGTIRGNGPCNSYSADQSVPYPWIQIGPIAATRRACPDLAAEADFFAALQSMTLAEVQGDTLILSNDAGDELVFRAGLARQ